MQGESEDLAVRQAAAAKAGSDAEAEFDPTVGALGESMRENFENKRWDELRRLLSVESLWLLSHPIDLDEAIATAADLLDDAEEIELTLLRILNSETSEAECRGSYLCRLGWYEPASTKQHEVSFDLHIGFRTDGVVRLCHLGFTQATPEPEIPSAAPAEGTTAASNIWIPSGRAALSVAGTDAVTVYVPVSVPAKTLSKLLHSSEGEGGET